MIEKFAEMAKGHSRGDGMNALSGIKGLVEPLGHAVDHFLIHMEGHLKPSDNAVELHTNKAATTQLTINPAFL